MPPDIDHKKPTVAFVLLCVIATALIANSVRARAAEGDFLTAGPVLLGMPAAHALLHPGSLGADRVETVAAAVRSDQTSRGAGKDARPDPRDGSRRDGTTPDRRGRGDDRGKRADAPGHAEAGTTSPGAKRPAHGRGERADRHDVPGRGADGRSSSSRDSRRTVVPAERGLMAAAGSVGAVGGRLTAVLATALSPLAR